MPGSTAGVVYRYDGSFEGMICCVYESFYRREHPLAITESGCAQMTLLDTREIITDTDHTKRVIDAIRSKISPEALDLVRKSYLTCLAEKELAVLRFLRLGFKEGPLVTGMLAEDSVDILHKAVRHMSREAHLLSGFIRFSDYDGLLVSVIEPKNCVLPLIADHFCDRYSCEAFVIHDATHELALLHQGGRREIAPMVDLPAMRVTKREVMYRALWKRFYDTIGVEGRFNPTCRMSHMPKRYWAHMTEFHSDAASGTGIEMSRQELTSAFLQ
jgi:probable DNA metabolism protein